MSEKSGSGASYPCKKFKLDKDLTLWLFQRFNCETESLEFESGISIPVRPLVKSVLGIPSGPIQVVEGSYFNPALYDHYYVGPKRAYRNSRGGYPVNKDKCMYTFYYLVKFIRVTFKQHLSEVRPLEELVYASVLDKTPKDKTLKHQKNQSRRIGRKCADSDTNTDAGADQFGTTVEDTTCNTRYRSVLYYSRATRSHKEGMFKQPEDPLQYGRSLPGASQKKHLVLAEHGTAIPSPKSLPIVEPPELDTSDLSAESASHEDSHTRQESLIIDANANSTHHHSVEQEHINFPRDGQQSRSNGPSSEPYAAQIAEGMEVAPEVSLGRNRVSPSMLEEGDRSAKKVRVEQPSGYVEPAGGGAIVDTCLLNCPLCSRPFKPPVFQCKGGHLACGTCIAKVPGIRCRKCEHGAAFDVHNMMMDTIVMSAKVKCPHDSCQSYVSYHELDDHQSTCPCAPCFCTEPRCSFVGLPLALHSHLTTVHSWPVHCIEYGKELRLQVPVSEPRHLLLGEEDDCVFLLMVGAVGPSTATAVSVVRIGACLPLQARYMLNILAYLPPAVASRRAHMLLLDMDVESNTRPGEVAVEELPSYLTVPPTYLVVAGASREVSLDIRIDKIIS